MKQTGLVLLTVLLSLLIVTTFALRGAELYLLQIKVKQQFVAHEQAFQLAEQALKKAQGQLHVLDLTRCADTCVSDEITIFRKKDNNYFAYRPLSWWRDQNNHDIQLYVQSEVYSSAYVIEYVAFIEDSATSSQGRYFFRISAQGSVSTTHNQVVLQAIIVLAKNKSTTTYGQLAWKEVNEES